jgi:integrase
MSVRAIKVHGRKVWQARVAYRGARRSTIRASKPAARAAEAALLQALQAAAAQAERQAQAPATLRTLLERYAQDMQDRGKAEESVARVEYTALAIERLCPGLLDTPVSAVGDADVFLFRGLRLREGATARTRVNGHWVTASRPAKASTVNRDLRTLRAALKLARPDYRFPGKAFLPEDETRVRWLRPDEELTVLEPMPSPFREIAKLAALTLMRLTEVRTLRREMVHLEQGVVLLPRTKGAPRAVVLSAAARKLLQVQLEGHTSAWVFPSATDRPYSREQIGRVFRRATRAAGLKDFHFHDLRHHGATMALNKGFTAPIVMQLGGWKTERMMRRYAAVTDQTLRAAAEAVSGNEAWQQPRNPAPAQASR